MKSTAPVSRSLFGNGIRLKYIITGPCGVSVLKGPRINIQLSSVQAAGAARLGPGLVAYFGQCRKRYSKGKPDPFSDSHSGFGITATVGSRNRQSSRCHVRPVRLEPTTAGHAASLAGVPTWDRIIDHRASHLNHNLLTSAEWTLKRDTLHPSLSLHAGP